jgi:hypothetical protein
MIVLTWQYFMWHECTNFVFLLCLEMANSVCNMFLSFAWYFSNPSFLLFFSLCICMRLSDNYFLALIIKSWSFIKERVTLPTLK